jgi:hypothetical protein
MVCGRISAALIAKKQPRGISKHKKTREKHTLSIPSISRALFVPLGGGGGATELLSSLPLAEEPGASDPRPRFLVVEANEGLPEAARRCASMSFLRFAASSLFSSVSLRMRSCETQSSHLQKRSACRLGDLRCRLRYKSRWVQWIVLNQSRDLHGMHDAGSTIVTPRPRRSMIPAVAVAIALDTGPTDTKIEVENSRIRTCFSSPCSGSCTHSHRPCR